MIEVEFLQEKVCSFKRRIFGLFEDVAFKSEKDLASVVYRMGVTNSLAEAIRTVQSLPDVLNLEYPRGWGSIKGFTQINMTRLKNPRNETDANYKLEMGYSFISDGGP